MEEGVFKALTIINSVVLGVLPFIFFRRQKLQEIKYKELMELNIKTHDITKRADKSLKRMAIMDSNDYDRLDYLISRYKKHSKKLSEEIDSYRQLWEETMEKNKIGKMAKKKTDEIIEKLLNKSDKIRELADELLK